MKTQTLIQAQANILKLTSLQIGNTVKVIEKDYSSTKIFYGIVTDLINTGAQSFIQLALYEKTYSDLIAKTVVYSGEAEINILPTTVEEVKENLGSMLDKLKRDVEEAKKALQNKIESVNKAEQFLSGEMQKKLTAASFTELTQEEYNLELKKQKIEAIEKGD